MVLPLHIFWSRHTIQVPILLWRVGVVGVVGVVVGVVGVVVVVVVVYPGWLATRACMPA